MYEYKAIVRSVYDGDSCRVDLDLGFGVHIYNEQIRLSGINAPEVRGGERPAGILSRDWLRDKILGKEVTIKTIKDKKGKYGRYLGTIYLDGENINKVIVKEGMAVKVRY